MVVTPEFARALTEISLEIRRQVAALIDRKGNVEFVVIGDNQKVIIPDLSRQRAGGTRLRGLRMLHTHLKGEGLSRDDLVDLALLRFDLIAAITISVKAGEKGLPENINIAHLIPGEEGGDIWTKLAPTSVHQLDIDFTSLITALEDEFVRKAKGRKVKGTDGAILVGISRSRGIDPEDSMEELIELSKTSGLTVLDTLIQKRERPDPKWVIGKGKLSELLIRAMQIDAEILVFDGELSPAQIRAITDFTELKVIDRTQVILDIFARRAKSRQGKIQVELAQLKYLLPRLIARNSAMSRLTGGIGGRGPGETKLEINRRRVRDRIIRLEKDIKDIERNRGQQAARRVKKSLPIISIIGYTNAGKSTLLNRLTKSSVDTRDMLFATLDTSSRRLRFPRDIEVIITDTVGFIRDLPEELMAAFSATLDELKNADLLLQVVDASDPKYKTRIEAVDTILSRLGLIDIPILMAFNKMDLIDMDTMTSRSTKYNAVPISAIDSSTLMPLIERLQDEMLFVMGRREVVGDKSV